MSVAAELEVLIVRHRASGWVSDIARKEDAVRQVQPPAGAARFFMRALADRPRPPADQ